MRHEIKLRLLMAVVSIAMATCPIIAVLKYERYWWSVALVCLNTIFWAVFYVMWWKATARDEVR